MSARTPAAEVERILAEVADLLDSMHTAGTLRRAALTALANHAGSRPLEHSMETGTGKSTLLLSHISRDHKVFTVASELDSNYSSIRDSPLLNKGSVDFVIGPTQRTLPAYRFTSPLQLALLDGPHGYPFPDLEYLYTYPNLEPGALLVIDDIHIPTVFNLFAFLREEAMFRLLEVVGTTAFFRRTDAPTFPPDQDYWETQGYNLARFPLSRWPAWGGLRPRIRGAVPVGVRKRLKRMVPSRLRKWLMT